ncbi:MAG TPA: multicopper oxidase domain-containing protein [Terriglobales bacterium]|jgi:FtsP/CotA-like multicopper oxidase with cupredoxin domain|nr:multicopper oxidase domain-containing protein [Terriglobales bacterium]
MQLHFSTHCRILLSLILLGCGALIAESVNQQVVANSNQVPAGHLHNGQLTIRLEAAMGEWSPEENDGPALKVAAFREEGGRLSTPGPLLRVPEGTEINATVYNRLDQPLTLHGLHARPGDAKEVLVIPSGESREVHFLAGAPGTYFYWGSRNGASMGQRQAEDGQLNGAFLVDPKDYVPNAIVDRTLIITNWLVVDDETAQPPRFRDVLGINGLSWPHTERLTYRVGQSVHWRIINASNAIHPMHLHGFYFRVDSVGDAESDTIYGDDQRRMAVTELLRPGRTFTLTWTPSRSGNWLFHCHVLPHIAPQPAYWKSAVMSPGTAMADHAREGMAGLVMAITILPTNEPLPASAKSRPPTRKMELVASELPGLFGKEPGMAFAIKKPGSAIQPTIPGPPILLTQGEPTAIRVVNRLPEPLTVHWHGIELESYYDGVAGVSGAGRRLMPPIVPGKSFVARLTPPRAGTFIYHTHIDDAKQLSSGLYGPLIVLPPGEKFDPERDRVLVISRAGPGETSMWINGSQSPEIGALRTGQKYRLRIINIAPENPPIDVSLKVAGIPATWRPIAKDGADLPEGQRKLCPAQVTIAVGETYDFELRPDRVGELTLEVVRPPIRFPAQITPSHKAVELRPESRIAVNIAVRE